MSTLLEKIGYWLLAIGVVGLRFPFGGYLAITGPTLLYISKNVAQPFETVTWVFSVYSISYIGGSILTGFIFSKISRMDTKLAIMGIAMVIAGTTFSFVPVSSRFFCLIIIYVITGIIWGFLNVSSMQLILSIWSTNSGPIIQASLMIFSLGALTTSMSCRIFLAQEKSAINCGLSDREITNQTTLDTVVSGEDDLLIHQPEFYPFVINSALHMFFGIILLTAKCFERPEVTSNKLVRPEKSFQEIWLYGIFYTCFHIGTALDLVYHSLISTYLYCGPMDMEVEGALSTNFQFWCANFVGRICMVPLSAKFRPKILIIVAGSLGYSGLIFQTVYSGNPENSWTVPIAAIVIGCSMSGMMGLGVSYGNEFTNMAGRYAMLTFIGMQFTGAVVVKVVGYLMTKYSYEWLLYMCLILAALQMISFIGITKIGNNFLNVEPTSEVKETDDLKANAS